ncbi:MAG: FkbM family methyltransferase [Xanthomonadales bacterium]|nr:FkbM family methyltransferase [Xanthomonadales bacterium]
MIFDIGAFTGEVATVYRKLFPEAQICCFEPNPQSFELLRERLKTDTARLFQLAVSADGRPVVLNANAAPATSSVLRTDARAVQHWGRGLLETVSEIEVASTTIDVFCQEHGIDKIDILKIDVQGFELAVLKGAGNMLGSGRIRLVYLELIACPTYEHQPRLGEYFELLDAHGYVLSNLFDPVVRDGRLLQIDAVFIAPNGNASPS